MLPLKGTIFRINSSKVDVFSNPCEMEENILTGDSDGVFRHGRWSDDRREVLGGVHQTPPAPQPLYTSAFHPHDGRRGGDFIIIIIIMIAIKWPKLQKSMINLVNSGKMT